MKRFSCSCNRIFTYTLRGDVVEKCLYGKRSLLVQFRLLHMKSKVNKHFFFPFWHVHKEQLGPLCLVMQHFWLFVFFFASMRKFLCVVWCHWGETTDHCCISHPPYFCQSHIKAARSHCLLPIYINKHPYHKPYSCQPQHSSALIVVLRYQPQPPSSSPPKKNLHPASTSPQPPNHLQKSTN